jgi:hypothetical protein
MLPGFNIGTDLKEFNSYIMNYDKKMLHMSLKRSLLYILGKCIAINDNEEDSRFLREKDDRIDLASNNNLFKIYLKLDYIDYIDYRDYEKHYTLHAIYGLNDIELVHMIWMEEDKIKFEFKVLSDDIKDFTDEQYFLTNAIIANYVNSNMDGDGTEDLFRSIVVMNEDEENDS